MSKKDKLYKLIRYGFFGSLSACIELGVFMLLSSHAHVYVASSASFLTGLIFSFVFNKFIVFKNSKKIAKGEVLQFFTLGLVNSQVSSLLTYSLSFVVPKTFAKIITIGLIAGWNYLLMNFIIFKKKENQP